MKIHHQVSDGGSFGNVQVMQIDFWINTPFGRLRFEPLFLKSDSMTPAEREAKINAHAAWLRKTLESLK